MLACFDRRVTGLAVTDVSLQHTRSAAGISTVHLAASLLRFVELTNEGVWLDSYSLLDQQGYVKQGNERERSPKLAEAKLLSFCPGFGHRDA